MVILDYIKPTSRTSTVPMVTWERGQPMGPIKDGTSEGQQKGRQCVHGAGELMGASLTKELPHQRGIPRPWLTDTYSSKNKKVVHYSRSFHVTQRLPFKLVHIHVPQLSIARVTHKRVSVCERCLCQSADCKSRDRRAWVLHRGALCLVSNAFLEL